jgi:LacI family transcriptional regulator
MRIPDDLAVIGFDDIDLAEYMDLTTIRQELDESGKLATEILLSKRLDPDRPPQHLELPLTLIARRTT